MRRLLILLPVVLALAGCGQASTGNSAEEFEGEERAVAQVVEDLQEAGERQDAEKICSDILAEDLAARLKDAGTTCPAEIERSIQDADDFELEVEDVTVTGESAKATVRRGTGEREERTVFEFVRASGSWRATSLAAGG